MIVAAVFAAATITIALPKMHPFTSGPIASGGGATSIADAEARTFVGYQEDVGTRLGYGQNLLRNTSDRPVKVRNATLVARSSTQKASVVDARVRPATNEGSVAIGKWPWDTPGGRQASNATTEPLNGFIIPPKSEVWLIFIIDLNEPGRTDWESVQINYETKGLFGAKHRIDLPRSLSLCAPATYKCHEIE